MKYRLYIVIIFLLGACHYKENKKIEQVLNMCAENRTELEKVLGHYKDNPKKLQAAKFLIKNMPIHYSMRPEIIQKIQPAYNAFINLREKYLWMRGPDWAEEADSLDILYGHLFPPPSEQYILQDIQTIKADWMIEQIDLAFKAWEENIYAKDLPFEIFLEYILPHRRKDGMELDNSRSEYYEKYRNFFNGSYGTVINAMDSALYESKDIMNNIYHGTKASTAYNARMIEKLIFTNCENKCWYNTTTLTAAGMAIATDNVPAWGNLNNNHSWNVLIMNDGIYPFEPFWDLERWKYKVIYNNNAVDRDWGKFRLPKVFRKTYSFHLDGPIGNKNIPTSDIPTFFRNIYQLDVSEQYFETSDVTVHLPHTADNLPPYLYLCVYNSRKWEPVQWGKRKGKNVTFKKMGRDIVYITGSYKNGEITTIGNPFYLTPEGKMQYIRSTKDRETIYARAIGRLIMPADKWRSLYPLLDGGTLLTSRTLYGEADTLHIFTQPNTDVWENKFPANPKKATRYVHISFPMNLFSLNEITCFYKDNGKLKQTSRPKLLTRLVSDKEGDLQEMMTDGLSATGFFGYCDKDDCRKVTFDLGTEYPIEFIQYIPYTYSDIHVGQEYILWYWDNSWHKVSETIGDGKYLRFENVPKGALLRITTTDTTVDGQKGRERIFTYDNGVVYWR